MASSDDFPLIAPSSNLHTATRPRDTTVSTTTDNNVGFFPRPFPDDPDRSPNPTRNTKRSSYYNKKLKPSPANPNPTTSTTEAESSSGPETASQRGDYRKDREEWSDTAIACLLEAYIEKFNQLNRGNLRGRDWEEVAEMVSEQCGGAAGNKSTHKTVEQCKNKIDNLKKRYKVEMQRITSSGLGVSNWHWFKKLEVILGTSVVPKGGGGGGSDDERSSSRANYNVAKQPKRYTPGSTGFANNLKSKSMPNLKWRRVMLKISGAALAGDCQSIDPKVAMQIAGEVATACRLGVEVAVVVGGRNFFCGDTWVSSTGLDRSTAYQIGMMATVMNSVLLQSALEKVGIQTRVQTASTIPEVSEPYNRLRAIRHLEKGRVVIFGGIGAGTGNYLFTTDMAAALRASELNAEAVLKGTNFNDYTEVVSSGISSIDVMALTYCEENGIPVVIFNLLEPGNISRALCGDQVGTLCGAIQSDVLKCGVN